MLTTRFTELVGCTIPIQQAGMRSRLSNPRLAAAVSNAGGLGVVSVCDVSPSAASALLDEVEELTPRAYGANFLVPATRPEVVALAARRARLVEFFHGDPDPALVALVHAGGALACWHVGSTAEARAAVAAGCDLVGVRGVEAGGHVRGTVALLPQLAEVLDAIDVPVIAAGGDRRRPGDGRLPRRRGRRRARGDAFPGHPRGRRPPGVRRGAPRGGRGGY